MMENSLHISRSIHHSSEIRCSVHHPRDVLEESLLQHEMVVEGGVVSGLVDLILDKLVSPAIEENGQIFGARVELKRLKKTLFAISAVLPDVEQQQTTQHSVRIWLQNLKDIANDIEDVLDLISTQDLQRNFCGRSLAQKISNFISDYSLAQKLKAISKRLDEIAEHQRNFNFQKLPQHILPVDDTRKRATYPFVQESHVFGREQDKEQIISHLVSSSSHQPKEVPVLPIVGLGGMGKTTLAKMVFSDPRVQAVENFELRIWVHVSIKFVLENVLQCIIESATGENSSHLHMEAMKNKLHRVLASRTFLLVLDDVWIEDSKGWFELKEFLEVGSKRSKLIVTTREDRVASITGTMEAYKLKPLSDDHCWSIFVKNAFNEGEEEEYPSLVQIGKGIVRKCYGVPLAVKTLASRLRSVRDVCTWRKIEESELWKIEQAPNDILPVLKLSFDQLPFELRSCFSSCAMLKKGEFIERERLILFWMALGVLQPKEMNVTIEEIGNSYFNELISRSFFQVVKRCYGKIEGIQLHDLVHDLATYVTGEKTVVVSCNRHEIPKRVRHLVWEEEDLSERELPLHLLTAKNARSLIFHGNNLCPLSKRFLNSLISNFRCLRILSLAGFEFEDLPNLIGDLKHLRYLSLAGNCKLKGLPDSICRLVNLQALDVHGCEELEIFPRDLHNLLSLRFLSYTSKLTSFTGFDGWSSIQRIMIYDCKHLTSITEQIGTLITLRALRIDCCPSLASLPNSIRDLVALEELEIFACEKLDLTGWAGLYGLRSLRHLNIRQLPLLVHLPDQIQDCTSLEELWIAGCPNLNLPRGRENQWSIVSHIPKIMLQVYLR